MFGIGGRSLQYPPDTEFGEEQRGSHRRFGPVRGRHDPVSRFLDPDEPPAEARVRRPLSQRLLPKLLVTAVLALAGATLAMAGRELLAELPSAAARYEVQQWAEGRGLPERRGPWEAVRADLLQAQSVRADSPVLQETLGNLYLVGALRPWASEAEQAQWLAEAQRHYRHSLRLRPTDGMTWALLATALAQSGEYGQPFGEAAGRAARYGPHESHVRAALLRLLRTVMEGWDDMPAPARAWAADLYEQGTRLQRQHISRLAEPYGLAFESTTAPRAVPPAGR
jgi:hypothetical protein